MKGRLRKITITLEEDAARWATREEVSVSRFLSGILKERMIKRDAYQKAMRQALARKPFLKSDGRYLSREEVHDRERLR